MKQDGKTIVRMTYIVTLCFCLLTACAKQEVSQVGSPQDVNDSPLDAQNENAVDFGKKVLQIVEEMGQQKVVWHLIWQDEFEGETLDLSKWSYQIGNGYQGWGNDEAQYYTGENVFVKDGTLIIEARKEEKDGCQYTSGRIRTITDEGQILFGTQCGKIEARISMPIGEGLWPAFWMMPIHDAYGLWPLSGEIDIMEARGRVPNAISGAVHFGEEIPNNKKRSGDYVFVDSDISQFHVYGVEWDTNEIRWMVDDEVYFQTSNWYTTGEDGKVKDYPAPLDKPFYLLLNLAVGGVYDNGILPGDEMLPTQMKVDYVRVYENQEGYEEVSTKKKFDEMDVDTFRQVQEVENYIVDDDFSALSMQPLTSTPLYENQKWYFLTKEYINGKAQGELVDIQGKKFFHCHIDQPGDEKYAIQLQHPIPLVKGYVYVVKFRAKAEGERRISLQPIGMKNGEVVSYHHSISFQLDEEMKEYYCSFLMDYDSDLQGILEFNLGLEEKDVTIGDVFVSVLDIN